jgi:hypothetical protein
MTAKKSRRVRRQEELARQQRQRALRTWVPLGIIGLLLVALVIYRVFEGNIEGVTEVAGLSQEHDVNATFDDTTGLPPVGGVHYPSWQNCGIYDQVLDTAYAVHSMEHGAIWITYNPDLPQAEIDALKDEARGDGWVLMSPYPDQSSDVVLSAWGAQLPLDSASDERIPTFISRYKAQGPEQGATCTNGVGTPSG